MSITKNYKEGNKGSDFSYRSKVLKGLQNVSDNTDGISGALNNLSLESTQQQVLATLINLLAENKLDFEMKSIRDANGVVFQLRGTLDEETGVFTWDYIDAEGNAYAIGDPGGPVAPVEFLNPDGLLTAIEAELLDQGITLDSSLVELQAINANTDQLETLLIAIDTVLDNSLVQLQSINANTDQLETLSTDIKNLLTTIDADTSNIATSVAALELCCQATNTLLTTIDAVLDQVQTNTLNTVNELTSANVTLAAVQNELIALNNTAGTLATEATLELVRLQLVALNGTDFATENTLEQVRLLLVLLDAKDFATETTLNTALTTLGSILAQLDVDLSTRASEATLASLLAAFNAEGFAQEVTLADLNSKLNTLGQKASADSAPVVLSTEQEAILEAIKVAVQNLDMDVDGIATEVTLAALLLAFNNEDFATQTTLADLLTAFNAEDFATQTTLAALLAAFNAEDFSTETTLASLLTAFNNEDFASEATLGIVNTNLGSINTNIQLSNIELANILTALNGSATEVTLAALLTAFNGEDFASQTTLQALFTAFNAKDFASETTLASVDTRLTPATRVHNVVTATGVTAIGAVPLGSLCGSVINVGNAAGTWNGNSLPAGVSIPWTPIGNRDTYGAIAYDATGTTFIIEYTT